MVVVSGLMGVKASEIVTPKPIHKTIYVYSVDDFPRARNGVILLEEDTTYDLSRCANGVNLGKSTLAGPSSGSGSITGPKFNFPSINYIKEIKT